MTDKPTTAAGYGGGQTDLVRATCLYVATKLGGTSWTSWSSSAGEAVRMLNEDFQDHNGVGPRRVAEFIKGMPDDEIQADVLG